MMSAMTTAQKKYIRSLLDMEAHAVSSVPADNPYHEAVALMHKAVMSHGTVVVSGVGKAGDIGRKISSTLNSVGMRSVFLHPLEAAHGDLGGVHKNSVLLALSNSGKTREIDELVFLARKLHKGLKVIAITGHKNSPVARAANLVLHTGNPKEIEPMNLVPTTSSVVMLVIGDILTVLSMEKRRLTSREYQKHHHGGYIGKRVKKLARKK